MCLVQPEFGHRDKGYCPYENGAFVEMIIAARFLRSPNVRSAVALLSDFISIGLISGRD